MPAPRTDGAPVVEAAVLVGLEHIAIDELTDLVGRPPTVLQPRPGSLLLPDIELEAVHRASTIGAAFLGHDFAVPRPRALLGHENVTMIRDLARRVRRLGDFHSVRVSAAGSDSPVMTRIADVVAAAVNLPVDPEGGDLVVRIHPSTKGVWRVAVRTTPRPLSTRSWRESPLPGALEATVAAAMIRLSRPDPTDRFVDLCAGSGTILIERALSGPAASLTAVEINETTITELKVNARAAGVDESAVVLQADAARVPMPTSSVDVACTNPPWGHQMGTRASNRDLYPRLIAEAARILRPSGRLVLVSHEIRLVESTISSQSELRLSESTRVRYRGHHPRIWVLVRSRR